ncbi:MAG TPA: hypothetical protein VI895_14470 [Bdellovibrionota bacterium]|nr:hypothetical protein [Bdellovibrionota bacterium]
MKSILLACAVCFGAADQQTVTAIHRAIFFMVGCTAVVLAGVTFMMVRAIRGSGPKSISND